MWLDLSFVVNHGHAWFANDSQKRDDIEQNIQIATKNFQKYVLHGTAKESRVLFIYVKLILRFDLFLLGNMRICKEKTYLLLKIIKNPNIFL